MGLEWNSAQFANEKIEVPELEKWNSGTQRSEIENLDEKFLKKFLMMSFRVAWSHISISSKSLESSSGRQMATSGDQKVEFWPEYNPGKGETWKFRMIKLHKNLGGSRKLFNDTDEQFPGRIRSFEEKNQILHLLRFWLAESWEINQLTPDQRERICRLGDCRKKMSIAYWTGRVMKHKS